MSLQISRADRRSIQSFLLLPTETSRTWFYLTIVGDKWSHKPSDLFFQCTGSGPSDFTNLKSKIFRGKKNSRKFQKAKL